MSLTLDLPQAERVCFEILDVAGRRVWTETRAAVAGATVLRWHGRDAQACTLPSGVYLARVQAGGAAFVRRVALLR